jgi:four helix bundle protein
MMDLEDLRIYQQAMTIGQTLWTEVQRWDRFSRDTIGKQLVRSADSIAANISEGNGRFHYGENRQFCYYARGSIEETKTWLTKAEQRNLISRQRATALRSELRSLTRMLNAYIRTIGKN